VRTPTEVLRARMVELRKAQGINSQAALAARLDEVGYPIHETALARIESGARDVKLDEAVAIACALDVPLPMLLLPLTSGEDVALTSTSGVPAWTAYEWMVGNEPLTDPQAYSSHVGLLRRYERLQRAEGRARTHMYRAESAELLGTDQGAHVADYVDALQDVADAMRDLEDVGANAEALADQRLVKAIRSRGIEPRARRTVRLRGDDETEER
jgi:hypothetical protein